ncbi:MAG: FAD:protein FMN transferase [Candidatus Brocadiaceae bacterium]|nr:FAD:protein FMN transferase [Candidatus Brocadiaceae bacterium]
MLYTFFISLFSWSINGQKYGKGPFRLGVLFFLFTGVVCIASVARAQTETEPVDNFQLQTYLTEEQALDLVFPKCDEILFDDLFLTPEEKQALEKLLKRRLYEDRFTVYIGKRNGTIEGYAIITEEIGKFHPFTFIVGVKPDGKIKDIAVLVYRESRGGEIVRKRFLYQFIGKSFKHPIRINKDIINITGATMSVRYMCLGVRKVLGVIHSYYLSGKRNLANARPYNNQKQTAESNVPSEKTEKPQGIQEDEQKNKDIFADIKQLKESRLIMGTFAEITIYSSEEILVGTGIDKALDEMERIDSILSNYKKESKLSKLNDEAAKTPVACEGALLDVIEQAQFYSELSNGAFDITIAPMVSLWGFFHEKGHIPPEEDREKLLSAVSYKNVVIHKQGYTENSAIVSFKNERTKIDPGAIGKGYAVDRALDVVRKFDINNACINLGGNIYVLGTPPGKNAWKIGVQHPRNKNKILGYLELSNEATATSGDYERFFEIDGKRYSHIIDPRTGKPVEGTIAVTVIAPTGTEVDALSTGVFVLGSKEGIKLVKKIPGVDAMIAHEKNGEIVIDMTRGFHGKFKKTGNKGDDNVRWNVVDSDQ